jgi:hypothetical protein
MKRSTMVGTVIISSIILSACEIEDKIKESFVDYATPLSEQTSNHGDPARVLPPNPVGCPNWQKNDIIDIAESLTLPAGCRYDRVSLRILDKSDITLDCNGAVLSGLDREFRQAIDKPYSEETAPINVGIQIGTGPNRMNNITIKNCNLRNYVRGIRVTLGFSEQQKEDLRNNINVAALEDFLRTGSPKNVKIQDSVINFSHKDGIYIDRFVTGFVLENSSVNFTGAVGLYLDSGSEGAIIRNSTFTKNGHSDYDPSKRKRIRRLAVDTREAIAIDSSFNHTVENNTFAQNSRGAVFIYKNCNEHAQDPRQIPRYQSADNNLITNNIFNNEAIGVWVASRQSKDLAALECGSPIMAEGTVRFGPKKEDAFYYEDFAKNNQVSFNTFNDVNRAVVIEDDNNFVLNNVFNGKADFDVQVGTRYRTENFSHPVTNTTIQNNSFNTNASPHIKEVFAPVDTVIENNTP